MKRRSYLSHLVLIGAILGFGIARAISADEDPKAAARATLERIRTLREQRPKDGVLIFYQALVELRLGERDSAFGLLRSLKGRKLGLIPYRDGGFDSVWDDPKFQEIRKALADEEPETPAAPVAFRLTDAKLIPEGVAFDSKTNRFFIGSIAQRKIIVTDDKGVARDFSSSTDKLDAILGLRVDSGREQLYAVSTNGADESAKKERRNQVVGYDLKTGRLSDRFAAPEARQLNDMVVAVDGTLYVTDSEAGTLFRKKPDDAALTRFGSAGAISGANGIALGEDGALYVAISTGIARLDTATGAPTRLPQPDTVVTGGIDGLYWHEGDLFGVQNGTNPGRVIRISLTDKGNGIAGITVLQSHHHPEFDEPTTGVIARDALYVIGNSYVGHYQPDGSIKGVDKLKGPAIIAIPLHR